MSVTSYLSETKRQSRKFFLLKIVSRRGGICDENTNTEWPKKMYTLFTHQYLWNKFK